MKNNTKNLVLFFVLLITSCATSPERYTPVPYKEDISFYRTYEADRAPANIFNGCFDEVKKFFSWKKKTPAPEIADLATNHVTNKAITEAMAKNPIRYPKGFEEMKGAHIQYGFETEYLHEETEALLKNYMPLPPFFTNTKEEWLAYTPEKRLAIFDNLINADIYKAEGSKFFDYRAKGHLLKITEEKELSEALPDSFVYDAGHFELVLDPHDTAESLIQKIKVINKNFGVGSMQMTISNPIDKALLRSNKTAREALKSELIGYYNFMNDFDTLVKLETGYDRFVNNPKIQAAKSFNHPWLGPMTEVKHIKLVALVEGIVEGNQYSAEELRKMSTQVVSHKFIGGLSFRPDVAFKKNRLASEVRDCHQNVKCIEDRIIRETYFLMKGKENFKKFSQVKQFDTIANYKDIHPEAIKYMLSNIFPAFGGYSQTEMQLYRNFSYPYRDWSRHIEVLGVPGLKEQISLAQQAYTEALKQISIDYAARTITKEEAQIKVMGALTEFSKKSGLVDAMKAQYDEMINPDELKNFNILKFSFYFRNIPITGKSIALVG
jgi:hypothetical protein